MLKLEVQITKRRKLIVTNKAGKTNVKFTKTKRRGR